MWVILGIGGQLAFVGEDVFDGPEGDHDEGEGGVGGVEAVGPVDDEADSPVESFVAGVVDAEADGGEDAISAFADRLGRGDERFEAAARGLRAEPVEEHSDFVFGQVAGEHGPQCFFEGVRPPQLASFAFQLAQGGGLVVGEVARVFEQRPAGSFEPAGRVLVG